MPENKEQEVQTTEDPKTKHPGLAEASKEDLIAEIETLRGEAKNNRLGKNEALKQLEEAQRKLNEYNEAKKIEDGKLQELLDDYKVKNTELSSQLSQTQKENELFKKIHDRDLEAAKDKLTDQQREFMEGLNYFKKIEYINQIIGTQTNLPPDQKKLSHLDPKARFDELMKKYNETGDLKYMNEAAMVEKEILKAQGVK